MQALLPRPLSWDEGLTMHALLCGLLSWGYGLSIHGWLCGPLSWGGDEQSTLCCVAA